MSSWHNRPLGTLESELQTDIQHGLTAAEAAARRERYGLNALPKGKREPMLLIFLRQFQSPLIYVLLTAAVIVLLTGERTDALIIIFVLLFNAVVGTLQEGRAQNTLEALTAFATTSATVLRDNEELILPDEEIVPGDIIILHEGERIPADGRVIEASSLRADEAALTGESVPVHKTEATLRKAELPLGEKTNMVWKGTHVTSGSGKVLVVATGLETELGRISESIKVETEIPLRREIRALSRVIIAAVAGISLVIFLLGWLLNSTSAREMFAVVVSLAVSVIPEGLPVVMTLVLATGVWRMAKRQALVKKLQAVEALGQAKVIAVDKTGTLTRNEMIIRRVFVAGKEYEIGGTGYEPRGEFRQGEKIIDPPNHPELLLAGKLATFCANARVALIEDHVAPSWKVMGDPTEAAMLVFGEKMGFHKEDLEREAPLLAELPFDYKTKYHVTAHADRGKQFVTVAGAPESVLTLCTEIYGIKNNSVLSPAEKTRLENTFHNLAAHGFRVVAFAFAERPFLKLAKILDLEIESLVFAGFFAMEDSLRPEVPQAMERARAAGIRIVMITGDHRLAAVTIAKEAGIWQADDKVLTGEELAKLNEQELAALLPRTSVFARVTPEDKLKIISAYRKRGEIVAMTGDGVNDAPSLVAADLGVAMGKIGTEVAKTAADIVLLDDNFGSIVSAVEEGRSIYKTIKKVILYLFSTSLGEVLTIAGALMLGFPLPLLAAQILWLNLVTDGFLDVALGMEPKEKGLLNEKFGSSRRQLVDRLMGWRMLNMALPMMIGSLIIFRLSDWSNMEVAWTWTLTTLAIFQWFNAWNCRSETKSIFQMNPLSNPFLVLATLTIFLLQLAAVYTPFLQGILHTAPLSLTQWLWAAVVALSIIFAEETRKAFARKRLVA